jgi:integrase
VLRATAATLLLDAGTSGDLVQALLGHASPVYGVDAGELA